MTRILIAAEPAVVRAGLEAILSHAPQMEIIGGRSPTSLVEGVEKLHPDVVLVEMGRGAGSPAPLLLSLGGAAASVPVVLMMENPDGDAVAEALRLGARAVLPREAQPEEIVAAVEAAAAGLLVLHAEELQLLLPLLATTTRAPAGAPLESLTPREIEVLHMLAEGEGNKIIARHLGISEHTVKFHVGSILAKLGASSRTEAVTMGVRQGIILL